MAGKERAEEAFKRGKQFLDKKRPLQAMLAFTEAVKSDDQHYESYLCRAEAFLQLEYHHLAREDAEKCIELKPQQLTGYLKKAKIEYEAEAYKEARKTLEDGLDVDSMNAELLKALHDTNNAERRLLFSTKGLHMKGVGVGSFAGVIFILVNELILTTSIIPGIIMKGIVFTACAYLGYAATKFYTDIMEQHRKMLLEPPKDLTNDPFAGMSSTPDSAAATQSKKKR